MRYIFFIFVYIFLKFGSEASRVYIFMSRIHNPKPMILCTLLVAAYIELYEVRNPHKNTFCHMLPLVALPRVECGSHILRMGQINSSNPRKTLAAYLKGLKEAIHAFCGLRQQIKSYFGLPWQNQPVAIPNILFSAAIKWLFEKRTKNLFRSKSKWQLERLFTPKETAKRSLPTVGCAKQNVTLPLRIQTFFRYSLLEVGVLYTKPKGMRLTKERGTKPVCILLPYPRGVYPSGGEVAAVVPPPGPLCYAIGGRAAGSPVGGRGTGNFYGADCKRSQTQLRIPPKGETRTPYYGIGCQKSRCRKPGSFSFLDAAYFKVNGYNRDSVVKNHAAIMDRKIENDGTNKRDFCYTTKAFKGKSISVSVLGLSLPTCFAKVRKQPATPKRGLGPRLRYAVWLPYPSTYGRGEEHKSLTVLRGLHLLENSIKSTKKRKSVLKLYLATQISPIILADNKSNPPKLERLMLPLPPGGIPPGGTVAFIQPQINTINTLPWYNKLFDFRPLICYGVRHFTMHSIWLPKPQSNAAMFRRLFLFSTDLPLLPTVVPSQVSVAECITVGRGKHAMSMRSIYDTHKRYCTRQKRAYWLHRGVVTFLNYKPVYKQLASQICASSGFQAIFCYHWVRMHTHKVLFAKLLHTCTWVSWLGRSEQALAKRVSRMQNAYGFVKNSKKGSHLLVDTAKLSLQKHQIKSFFKKYLLYLKKLISQPSNLPLPFLITKLNRSILSWKPRRGNLPETWAAATTLAPYGCSKPVTGSRMHTERGGDKNPINNSEIGYDFFPTYGSAGPLFVAWAMATGTEGSKPITQFHTHGLKQSVLYKNKPQYLESSKKKQQSQYLNFYISKLLWKLVKKKHPTQSNRWLFDKYWKFMQNVPHFYALEKKRIYFVLSSYV